MWQIQEAKARFTELVRLAERDGPQAVTRHGERVAVVISQGDYDELRARRRSLVEQFSGFDLGDLQIPPREKSDVGRHVDLT